MNDILGNILANKRIEVENAKKSVSFDELKERLMPSSHVSLHDSLAQSSSGIIAEFKRKSPSKGWIHPGAEVADVAPLYQSGGAAAMSVLTDDFFFGGNLSDLSQARALVNIPLLRKDFIIDRYQLWQAAIAGADAVLLIAAALTRYECNALARDAHSLGLDVLLEIHSESELNYVTDDIRIVGVNNRNLGSFHTDVQNSLRIADKLPNNKILVSESGISNPETVRMLRDAGYRGFLIGESFMKHPDPGYALASFISQLR